MAYKFNTKIIANKPSMKEAEEAAKASKFPTSIKETKKGRFIVFEKYR